MNRIGCFALASFVLVAPMAGSAAASAAKQVIQPVPGKQEAPAIELHDSNGQQQSLADYRGKIVAVNFWATWCPPCRKELPSMQHAYDDYKGKGFVILGVNEGEDWQTVRTFLKNASIKFPILLDPDGTEINKWHVLGLPTTFIVDRKGRIAYRINGGHDWDNLDFRKALQTAINEH